MKKKFAHTALRHALTVIAMGLALNSNIWAAVSASADLEVLQANATLQFHSKQTSECLATLKKILDKDPKNVSALELQALTQRQLQQDEEAAKTYEHLLETKAIDKFPAYHFELGSIRYKQKNFAEAKSHFLNAALHQFNPGMSHFFMGVIDFNNKSWRNARNNLAEALTYSDANTMRPITKYYLANTYAQMGKSDAAIRNYGDAYGAAAPKQTATTTTSTTEAATTEAPAAGSQMFSDIRKNSIKELRAMDRGNRFLNLSLLSQWDSNVQTNPSDVERNAEEMSGQRTSKGVLSASIGFSTSPTRLFQVTPSYRFFTNYNFNYQTKDFNFMSQTPSLYVMVRPYARFSAGLKAEGTLSMKNFNGTQVSGVSYRKYSQSAEIGPIAKYEVSPTIGLTAEVVWRPKTFFLDPISGDSRRSGHGIFSKLTADFATPLPWISPNAYVSHEWDNTYGKDYRAYTYSLGVANPLSFTEKFTLTPTLDVNYAHYYETVPGRDDVLMSLRVMFNYVFNSHWSGLADLGYTLNESSISATYKYNRVVVSAGASYTF